MHFTISRSLASTLHEPGFRLLPRHKRHPASHNIHCAPPGSIVLPPHRVHLTTTTTIFTAMHHTHPDLHLPPSYPGLVTPHATPTASRGSDASAHSTASSLAAALAATDAYAPPPPPTGPGGLDGFETLPEYTPKDAELERRESITRTRWAEREAAIAAMWAEEARERRERAQRRASQPMNALERWNRWSAKFYMPILHRWPAPAPGQHH